ncbi:leucyl/phenylalanyl-tRNA--protein transferase [Salinimonas sp. HHU 13199]|uniref:Leucyl/phenylalanyl-tRNA--protein transferase n=1 Tax=Salinimonas profundi TaxID=2729140 RepID=A0ABR8LJ46_9ALTE|nr:leucyl/phenylalanyl-tRNA--protein transferase [Salinimonas profundi]MBD3584337.1 leucyl/phenylalanyl-tRNA--protein transferase [Salinimonas profundi]
MIELPYLTQYTPFPPVSSALTEPNGLLAFGGDLSVRRLLSAYSQGIFPWFSDNEPLLWWSPDPRAIIELNQFHCARSLRKLIRQKRYIVTLNQCFSDVINLCATIPRQDLHSSDASSATWITDAMKNAYIQLHEAGFAHSIEVWDANSELAGGLYGVAVGNVFCGESMFHKKPNTSKLAMYALVKHMQTHGLAFIDCQMPTEHLASLGAITVSREDFISRLKDHSQTLDETGDRMPTYRQCWQKQVIAL